MIRSFSYTAYRESVGVFRRSKMLARLLFHVRVPGPERRSYWDWVTSGLRTSLREQDMAGTRFLEMGCGFVPVLSLLAHHLGCRDVTAADVVPECVDEAETFLAQNGVDAEVLQSDFDRNLPEGALYDVIVFNPPYVPEKWQKYLMPRDANGTAVPDQGVRSFGGKDGSLKIAEFLDKMPKYLTGNGKILIGVNRFYVRDELVRSALAKTDLKIEGVKAYALMPVNVYTLRRQAPT